MIIESAARRTSEPSRKGAGMRLSTNRDRVTIDRYLGGISFRLRG
jgi:hypothetical protein